VTAAATDRLGPASSPSATYRGRQPPTQHRFRRRRPAPDNYNPRDCRVVSIAGQPAAWWPSGANFEIIGSRGTKKSTVALLERHGIAKESANQPSRPQASGWKGQRQTCHKSVSVIMAVPTCARRRSAQMLYALGTASSRRWLFTQSLKMAVDISGSTARRAEANRVRRRATGSGK
jgi:hypothetical protein